MPRATDTHRRPSPPPRVTARRARGRAGADRSVPDLSVTGREVAVLPATPLAVPGRPVADRAARPGRGRARAIAVAAARRTWSRRSSKARRWTDSNDGAISCPSPASTTGPRRRSNTSPSSRDPSRRGPSSPDPGRRRPGRCPGWPVRLRTAPVRCHVRRRRRTGRHPRPVPFHGRNRPVRTPCSRRVPRRPSNRPPRSSLPNRPPRNSRPRRRSHGRGSSSSPGSTPGPQRTTPHPARSRRRPRTWYRVPLHHNQIRCAPVRLPMVPPIRACSSAAASPVVAAVDGHPRPTIRRPAHRRRRVPSRRLRRRTPLRKRSRPRRLFRPSRRSRSRHPLPSRRFRSSRRPRPRCPNCPRRRSPGWSRMRRPWSGPARSPTSRPSAPPSKR